MFAVWVVFMLVSAVYMYEVSFCHISVVRFGSCSYLEICITKLARVGKVTKQVHPKNKVSKHDPVQLKCKIEHIHLRYILI